MLGFFAIGFGFIAITLFILDVFYYGFYRSENKLVSSTTKTILHTKLRDEYYNKVKQISIVFLIYLGMFLINFLLIMLTA